MTNGAALFATSISSGVALAAGIFLMMTVLKSRHGVAPGRDRVVSILFGAGLVLTLLFGIAAGMIALAGMAAAGVFKAVLALTGLFALGGIGFGLRGALRKGPARGAVS